jgi:hypothetical protein
MAKLTRDRNPGFKVLCISCGVIVRENAKDDSYRMCREVFLHIVGRETPESKTFCDRRVCKRPLIGFPIIFPTLL